MQQRRGSQLQLQLKPMLLSHRLPAQTPQGYCTQSMYPLHPRLLSSTKALHEGRKGVHDTDSSFCASSAGTKTITTKGVRMLCVNLEDFDAHDETITIHRAPLQNVCRLSAILKSDH